ncbi:hypothetical protein Syun_004054 [Stephania yunnanensis]|uniref:Uncharacterized protein n=1 Tax=Stephania yunnanensis TaxID=152371 RepID=A0AAP0L2A2_9MAGN
MREPRGRKGRDARDESTTKQGEDEEVKTTIEAEQCEDDQSTAALPGSRGVRGRTGSRGARARMMIVQRRLDAREQRVEENARAEARGRQQRREDDDGSESRGAQVGHSLVKRIE